MRKYVASIFTKTQADFETPEAFNDYLEQKEMYGEGLSSNSSVQLSQERWCVTIASRSPHALNPSQCSSW